MTLRMADAIYAANLPAGMDAYAGYVGGRWPDYWTVAALFPAAHLLSIAVFPSLQADCLDVETGDATVADVPAWIAGWRQVNTFLPVLYTSASNAGPLVLAAQHDRSAYVLWTAHYTNTPHICDSTRCWPSSPVPWTADATQWTDHAGVWDESLLSDRFFTDPPPPPAPPAPPPPVQKELDMFLVTLTDDGPIGVKGTAWLVTDDGLMQVMDDVTRTFGPPTPVSNGQAEQWSAKMPKK